MPTYAPMTELEAVNSMLELIGEQPVNMLTGSGVPEVEIAKGILHRNSREVQTLKLHCNTESNYPLPLNTANEVVLPANALNVSAYYPTDDLTKRGGKLYDLTNHTFKFPGQVRVNITFFLPFEDLPEHVRSYIAIRAARQFQARYLTSQDVHALTEKDEQEALREFKRTELNNRDISMLDSPSVARVVRRSFI